MALLTHEPVTKAQCCLYRYVKRTISLLIESERFNQRDIYIYMYELRQVGQKRTAMSMNRMKSSDVYSPS
jgi:hypothetical protein